MTAASDTPFERDGLAILARRSAEIMQGPLPEAALHAARRALVDWVGLALGGLRDPTISILLSALPDGGCVAVPGTGRRLAPHDAALVLGAASHVLDYDDTDPVNLIHISSTLFPALFATAAQHKVSGETLLRAVVAGFEAESRLGEFLGRPLTASGWHVTGVIGHFGAALASALIQQDDAVIARQAMSISAVCAGGLIAAFGTMSKALQVGRTAADGVLAARLARAGFTGPLDCLGENSGFARPFVGLSIKDWSAIDKRWGKPFAVTGNAFKPHASCMITHPAIDAAIGLRTRLAQQSIASGQIEKVICRVNSLVPQVAGIARPQTGLQGKFSVGFCVVAGLLEGRATPDLFCAERVAAADVATLLARTEIVVDPGIGEQQADIEVFAEGKSFVEETKMAKGNPANPLDDADLSRKFTALAQPLLKDRAPAALQDLWNFAAIEDAGAWFGRLDLAQETS